MFSFLHALGERLRGSIADGGLDFEARLLARDAERKAVLLRKAARYDEEGLQTVARELRQRAEMISFARPLASLMLATTAPGSAPQVPPNGHVLATHKKGR